MEALGLRSLLGEVVERVEGVATLADRLQGLLSAVVTISSQLDLDRVLEEIATTAAHVADAEYAALGVLAPGERRLSDFITVGLDKDLREKIGDLPHGRGVRSEEHTSELQSQSNLVCRLLLEKKNRDPASAREDEVHRC